MRILHTADWHLGKKLENFSRFDEQVAVMDEICRIADQQSVEVVLVAGDLFDNFNPSAETNELLYKTLKRLSHNGTRPVIAIAGNHDSADRIESPDPLARACGIFFSGYPHTHIPLYRTDGGIHITRSEPGFIEIGLPGQQVPLRLLLTPYANEIRLKTFLGTENTDVSLNQYLKAHWQKLADQYCDEKGVNILMAHLYFMKKGGSAPEESEDERSILVGNAAAIWTENIPRQIQYTALGHIHLAQNMDAEQFVYYSGSPLPYSFAEAGQEKYVNIIDIEPASLPQVTKIPLSQGRKLYRKHFTSVPEALTWLSETPEALVELTIDCENYLSARDRKSLFQAHDGIISIIPNLISPQNAHHTSESIDLTQNMEALFSQYFQFRKGAEPHPEMMALFRELVAKEQGE